MIRVLFNHYSKMLPGLTINFSRSLYNYCLKSRYCLRAFPVQRFLCTAGISGSSTTSTATAESESLIKATKSTKKPGPIMSFFESLLGSWGLLKKETDNDSVVLQDCVIRLYRQCGNADFLAFIKKFNMPDTMESWFIITGLHVWFILLRFHQEQDMETESSEKLREMFMDVLWDDVKRRLELLSRENTAFRKVDIRKTIVLYYSYIYTSMVELDEGIMCDDMVLAGALWRLFYKNQRVDDIVALNSLVRYVRLHVHKLNQRSVEDIIANGIKEWRFPDDL